MLSHFTSKIFNAELISNYLVDYKNLCFNQLFLPQTFSLVNKRMGKKVFFRFSKEKSLFFLAFTNPIRRFCIRLICTQWFDHFIISIILINCVLLAANYEDNNVE